MRRAPMREADYCTRAFPLLRAATGYSVCRRCWAVFAVPRGNAGQFCSRACYETRGKGGAPA